MIKKLYIRFVILSGSTFILPLIISLFYIMILRYIFIKAGIATIETNEPVIMEINKPEIIEIKNIIVKPKLENKVYYNPSNDYYSYFPYGDELPYSISTTKGPICTYPINIERDPFFTVSFEDFSLPETIVTNPPVIHKCIPPAIDIIVGEPLADELIRYHIASDIKKDMFNSIYEPSYEGTRNPQYSNVFELHIQKHIREFILLKKSSRQFTIEDYKNEIDRCKKGIALLNMIESLSTPQSIELLIETKIVSYPDVFWTDDQDNSDYKMVYEFDNSEGLKVQQLAYNLFRQNRSEITKNNTYSHITKYVSSRHVLSSKR